ncbi:spermatogenesis associated 2-like isoform 2-T3 [Pholidichthys leucotaenia]
MSAFLQTAREVASAYSHSLEQQIFRQGSSLPCRNEELWKQVEVLLRDRDAQKVHCLGLDPLRVMEESLQVAAASPLVAAKAVSRQSKPRGVLQGLAQAFEVLEQAALNLYLGPWREEYKEIKMYSGMFTHRITPVLSMPQIENLFGLLGYRHSLAQPDMLCLQSPRIGRGSPEDLLGLCCAFFLARCECSLLMVALGKNRGDARWELSIVRERRHGNDLEVALENTKRMVEEERPQMELLDEDVDLYRDEQFYGGLHQQLIDREDSSPNSLVWTAHTNSPLNGVTSQSGTSKRSDGYPQGEFCNCLDHPQHFLRHCVKCNTFHNTLCQFHQCCVSQDYAVEMKMTKEVNESGAASLQGGNFTLSFPSSSSSSAAISSLSLSEEPKSMISYHSCCNLTQLDPMILCHTCAVFHSASCKEYQHCCLSHKNKQLGKCSCGTVCTRTPLVLCRYCGNEYCLHCWYRNPLTCSCGQTFDQSSPV